jgi:hypothetical protein
MKRPESETDVVFEKLAKDAGFHPSTIAPSAEGDPVVSGLSAEDWKERSDALFETSEQIADQVQQAGG